MIRGESHDPVYTRIPNGLSGELADEAKDIGPFGHMGTLGSHPRHPPLLLQGTATTVQQGDMGFAIPSSLGWFVPNPKFVAINK